MGWLSCAGAVLCLLAVVGARRRRSYDGWGAITLHCRDNENNPVDWWYIYKPPPGQDASRLFLSGATFTYITSREPGRWVASSRPVTGRTMLQNTLEPLYRLTYRGHMAAVAYDSRNRTAKATMARGLLMADVMGGLWMGHSLPEFPDMSASWPKFPEAEVDNGHLLGCISLNLEALDALAEAVALAAPRLRFHHIPDSKLMLLLPKWSLLVDPDPSKKSGKNVNLELTSKDGLRLAVLARAPGSDCLYRTFAQTRGLVLDVFGVSAMEHLTSVCSKSFKVRNIEKISLKLPDTVYYIDPEHENSRFAVSTTAHWQRRGASKAPWACLSNIDKEDKRRPGGMMVCINDYNVWFAFDNLKVSEPKC